MCPAAIEPAVLVSDKVVGGTRSRSGHRDQIEPISEAAKASGSDDTPRSNFALYSASLLFPSIQSSSRVRFWTDLCIADSDMRVLQHPHTTVISRLVTRSLRIIPSHSVLTYI